MRKIRGDFFRATRLDVLIISNLTLVKPMGLCDNVINFHT